MKFFCIAWIILLIPFGIIAQTDTVTDKLLNKVLPREYMLEDFNFLRRILEETHPGLYRYTAKAAMQQKMDSLANSFTRDMPFYDYYLALASLIADIRCAHTYIIPKQNIGSYSQQEIKILPFGIMPLNNRLYISLNGTTDTIIRPGFEILSVNGRAAGSILKHVYRHTWADGFIQTSKTAQLSRIPFGLFYYLMVERPDSFRLRLLTTSGKSIMVTAPAMKVQTYLPQFYKNPVNQQLLNLYKEQNEKEQKQGWRLEMLSPPATALLRINAFGGGGNATEAAEKMRQFLDTSMATLKKKKVRHLVVDLRNNGGGWDIQGVELFTYLMKDTLPVRYYRRKHTITDSSEFIKFSDLTEEDRANIKNELIPEPDGTFSLKEEYNQDLKLQYARPNRFTGKIYFLINGGSGSTTSEFVAVAHSHKLGVFIGEESGGAYEGDNGGSFLHFELPHSGIAVGTPLIYYHNGVQPPLQKGRGVIPDYPVQASMNDFLQGRDVVLEKALELIRNAEKN